MADSPVVTTLPLFHGTRAPLRKGQTLVPGDELGKRNHPDGRSDRVFVTTSLGLAQVYAEVASGRGRPRVLQVVANGPLERDDLPVLGADSDGYLCASATVVDILHFT